MKNDIQTGRTLMIQEDYKAENYSKEGSNMNKEKNKNKSIKGKIKNNQNSNIGIFQNNNNYLYKLNAKKGFCKIENNNDIEELEYNTNYFSSEREQKNLAYNPKRTMKKDSCTKCIDNIVIKLDAYSNSISKKPPKSCENTKKITVSEKSKTLNREHFYPKISGFSSNNTQKTTNCSNANFEKNEAFKYFSNNSNTFHSILSSNDHSKNNNLSVENNFKNKDLNTISYYENDYHNNSEFSSLKVKKYKVDFDIIGEIDQQQNTVEKTIENFKHTNVLSEEISIHTKKQDSEEEDTSKKEELEDKINEIKIYLKKEFEKERERKNLDLSQNNNFLIVDDNNKTDNFQNDSDTKYKSTGYNKINFLVNQTKTYCEEALKKIKNEIKNEEVYNTRSKKDLIDIPNDSRRKENIRESIFTNNYGKNNTLDDLSAEDNQKIKNKIFNNLELLYDNESSRSKKRTEQIKRIRSSKSAASVDFKNFELTEKNLLKDQDKNYCLTQINDNMSSSHKEKSKKDIIDIGKIAPSNIDYLNGVTIDENRNEPIIKRIILEGQNLNTSHKLIQDNSNSNNISSLNITYINNPNINYNPIENQNNFLSDKIPINANIKNNNLLYVENKLEHDYNKYPQFDDNNNCIKSSNKNNIEDQNVYENQEIQNQIDKNVKQNTNQGISLLNVSDLDFEFEEGGKDEEMMRENINKNNFNDNNITILKNITNKNATFVNLKNNLKIKSDLEENKTESYMMALQGCSNNNQTDTINFTNEGEINKNNFINEEKKSNIENKIRDLKGELENFLLDNNKKDKEEINLDISNEEEPSDFKYFVSSNAHTYCKNKSNQNQMKIIYDFEKNNSNHFNYTNYDFINKNPENQGIPKQIHQEIQHGHNRSKSQEVSSNNFRVPSGRKYMVNSVIMEEISENYTDSEFSNKKKSFLFSKSKLESSEKIIQSSNRNSKEIYKESSHFNLIEKNLEKEIFNKMKSDDNFSKISIVESMAKDLKHNFIEQYKEFQNKKQELELKQKINKENKKREILELFYNKNNLGLNIPYGSKSENKQITNYHKEIQFEKNPKTYIKNLDMDSKNHIQNILISKFNFDSKKEKDTNLEYDLNKKLNNNQNNFVNFSENVDLDYNASSFNLLNYTNSYKNLVNVNSLSVLNLNSNNINYKSLTSNSNNKFSACKKSPSSLDRERFYNENHIDYRKISKNLNDDNFKLNLKNVLNDDCTERQNIESDYHHKLHREKDLNNGKEIIKNINFIHENNDLKNHENSVQDKENTKIKEIDDRKIDFLGEDKINIIRKAYTSKDQSTIDAKINISLNNSSASGNNKIIDQKNSTTNDIKSNRQNDIRNEKTCSNNKTEAYLSNNNLMKLEIELKSNSPIKQASNKDFDETMNVITESSFRNFNLNFNNNYNNNSNVNSNNATLINIFPNCVNTNNNLSNTNSIISYNNNTAYKKNNNKEKYKKERRQNSSSIFKSEDMRVSKIENLLLHNVNNLNSNTNHNSLCDNNTSNNNSNNTLLNFNCNIINNANNYNSANNAIINRENSNLFNNNNTLSSNSSLVNFNLNFNKNNLNNLHTNSLSDFVNFQNTMNVCSPLSTVSNLNLKNTFSRNLPLTNSNEKKDNKTLVQYDSKSEAAYNLFTGTLSPSRQNSFNLNVFVSRNDSNSLANFNNNNNLISNNFIYKSNLKNKNTNGNREKNINDYSYEKLENQKNLEELQNNVKNKDYSPSNKEVVNDNSDNNQVHQDLYYPNKNVRSDKIFGYNHNNYKLKIDKNQDISILENNDINEDCVEDQKNDDLNYHIKDLKITSEIELEFSNKQIRFERHKNKLVKSKSNEIFIKKSTGINQSIRMDNSQNKNKDRVTASIQRESKNANFGISEIHNASYCKNIHNKNLSDCFITSQHEIVKNNKNKNQNKNMLNNVHDDRSSSQLEIIRECDKDSISESHNYKSIFRNRENYLNYKKMKKPVKIPINLIYGKKITDLSGPENNTKKVDITNNKFANNFLYQNFSQQLNNNPNKTASIVINNKSAFSNSNSNFNKNIYFDSKCDNHHSYSKSISSNLLSKNITIPTYQSLNSTKIFTTTSNISNSLKARVTKISPAKTYSDTIDKSNFENNNNNIKKQTPLLADIKRYQDKLSKNNSNFEYKKINQNKVHDRKAIDTENKSARINTNFYENHNKFNKLVQMDKLNFSNNINKTSNNEILKNNYARKNSLIKQGFNFTNKCLNSVKDKTNNEKERKENFSPKEEKKRPSSSNCNIILKMDNDKDIYIENYTKINRNPNKKKINSCKQNSNEKANSRDEIDTEKNVKEREKNLFFLPNVDLIIKCLKFVIFPKNYLDYYKIVLNKLQHSKNNKFLICVSENKRTLEFKGLYEFQEDSNILNLIYCANHCETQLNFNLIKKFLKFCKETKTFKEENSFSKDCLLFIV